MATLVVDAHKNLPAYWESLCAAYLGETTPVARNAQEQFAIDRGVQDGEGMRTRRADRVAA